MHQGSTDYMKEQIAKVSVGEERGRVMSKIITAKEEIISNLKV